MAEDPENVPILPGRPYLRRALVVAAGAATALVGTIVVPRVAEWCGYPQLTWPRALWMVLTCEIVFAVYKWGVGGWSRYAPPPESKLRPGPPAAT